MNFDKEELHILSAALNEILHGIDVFEFATRIGVSKGEVFQLMEKINQVLESPRK